MALSNKCRKLASYVFPDEILNEAFPILLVAYATILSHLRSQAVSNTLHDLQDNEAENFVFNNTDVNVRSVSNAVMWTCQEHPHYKRLYIVALVLMIIFNFVTVCSRLCRPEFYTTKLPCSWRFLVIIEGLSFNVGLTFLVFSFDLSPLSCQVGSSSIDYSQSEEVVDFKYDLRIVRFIKAAPAVSSFCLFIWIIAISIRFTYNINCTNICGNICKNIFEDRQYDPDATKAKVNDDTYYEINYVNIKESTATETGRVESTSEQESTSSNVSTVSSNEQVSTSNTTVHKIESSNKQESESNNESTVDIQTATETARLKMQ